MHNRAKNQIIAALAALALILGFFYLNGSGKSGLNGFAQITEADPLMYDEKLDAQKLEAEIKILEEKEAKFLRYHGLKTRLFALDHLKLLGPIKIATENFLEKPSVLKAMRLTGLQKQFAENYTKESENLLKKLESVFKNRKEDKIIFFGGATAPKIIMDDIRLIIKTGEALLAEIEKREKCLIHKICKNLADENLKSKRGFNFRDASEPFRVKREKIETARADFQAQDFGKFLPPEILMPDRYDFFRGPYVFETGCFGFNPDGTPKKQQFYLFEWRRGGRTAMFPKLADEIYYLDLTQQNDPFAKEMLRRGVRYDHQLETKDYYCTDLTVWPAMIWLDRKTQTGEETKDALWTLPYILPTIPTIDNLLLNSSVEDYPPPEDWLYSVHTAYSLIYLTFSPSVWIIDEKPQYLLKESVPLGEIQTTYSLLKKQGFSDEKIKKFAFAPEPVLKSLAGRTKPANQQNKLFLWFQEAAGALKKLLRQ